MQGDIVFYMFALCRLSQQRWIIPCCSVEFSGNGWLIKGSKQAKTQCVTSLFVSEAGYGRPVRLRMTLLCDCGALPFRHVSLHLSRIVKLLVKGSLLRLKKKLGVTNRMFNCAVIPWAVYRARHL